MMIPRILAHLGPIVSLVALCSGWSEVNGQTTDKEYDFVTQKWKGDPDVTMNGYHMRRMSSFKHNEGEKVRTVQVHWFCTNSDSLVHAVVVELARKDNPFLKYLCLPMPGSGEQVIKQAHKDLNKSLVDLDPAVPYMLGLLNALNDMAVLQNKALRAAE